MIYDRTSSLLAILHHKNNLILIQLEKPARDRKLCNLLAEWNSCPLFSTVSAAELMGSLIITLQFLSSPELLFIKLNDIQSCIRNVDDLEG